MNDKIDRDEVSDLMDEYGLSEEDAAFAVRLSAGETDCDLKQHPWPLPEDVTRRWTSLLVEQHGFTPEEAAAYLQGDRSVIDAAIRRRSVGDESASIQAAAD